MKSIIKYTAHARYMMAVRDINEAEIELTIKNPDRTISELDETNKFRFEKAIDKIKIVVIAYWFKEKEEIKVKTVWKA